MSQFIQVLQNSLIRFVAFLSVVLKNIGNLFKNIFGFFANLFGFSESGYFLENDDSQSIKRSEPKPMLTTEAKTSFEPPVNNRRRNNKEMDYYLKMAKEIRES
ncbi:MAG: threonine dehydratase [Calothrix sp. C42_A2020_038]|nr:threonine dehydratase [Calothrix sp. C42_A2020_038]